MDVGLTVSSRRLFQGDSLFQLQFLLPTWLFWGDTRSILDKGPQLTKEAVHSRKDCGSTAEMLHWVGHRKEGLRASWLYCRHQRTECQPALASVHLASAATKSCLPCSRPFRGGRKTEEGENSLEASLPSGPESTEIFQVHSWVPVAGNTDPI